MSEPIILVCGRVRSGLLLLPDNLIGKCDVCGHLVEFRPHAPEPHVLRCIPCFVDLVEPDAEITTTPQMIADALTVIRKKMQ